MTADEDLTVSFADMPAEFFPAVADFYLESDRDGDVPVYTIRIPGPGAVRVPPLRLIHKERIWARMTFNDGTILDDGRAAPSAG